MSTGLSKQTSKKKGAVLPSYHGIAALQKCSLLYVGV